MALKARHQIKVIFIEGDDFCNNVAGAVKIAALSSNYYKVH